VAPPGASSSLLPLLDGEADLGLATCPEWQAARRDAQDCVRALQSNPLARWPVEERRAEVDAMRAVARGDAEARELRAQIRATEELVLRESLRRMGRVLRRLLHVTAEGVVSDKGRVACEINTADELLVTELVFDGAFNDVDAHQCAAMLSCLVNTEHAADDDPDAQPALPAALQEPFRRVRAAATRVAEASRDAKIPIDVDEYVRSFQPDLMELVWRWAKGSSFADVCKLTKAFEGTIIRVIRRLEELLRQLADAARTIGNAPLEEKFKEASAAMRRDIVFAASLYLG
jgi:ATP-dependent RNA helicase DOB1